MLELLVSSRIRRTLFEHLLAHPGERFYLRGLAKTLSLPISPLRRELVRLEGIGMLRAEQEGNMRLYTVNTSSPDFLQLQQASRQLAAGTAVDTPVVTTSARPAPESVAAASTRPSTSRWRSPLPGPVLVSAAGVGLTLMLIMVGLLYVGMTNRQLVSETSRALATRKAEVTVVVPSQEPASTTMQGSRWRIVPGSFGGFASGAGHESY